MATNGVFGSAAVLLGHRGLGRGTVEGLTENSLASFLTAVELGLDWVEVDVRRTRDDVLVVAHNQAREDGAFWADLTGEQARAGGVLTLDDLLAALPERIGIDFDVKSCVEDALRPPARTTMGLLAPVVARENRRRPTLVTSFDAGALGICREQAPGVARGLLTWVEFPAGQAVAFAAHLGVQVVALHGGSLKASKYEPAGQKLPLRKIVQVAHKGGMELMAWCPGIAFGRRLLDAGVDALCVNNVPAYLRELSPVAA